MPPLALIDSIILSDTNPDAAINRPSRIYLGQNGEFLIGDFTSASVFRFDRAGTFLNLIGRKGEGPGEFESPSMVAVLDTTILVFDGVRRNAQLFSPDGAYLNTTYDVPFIAEDIAVNDKSVWATGVSFDSPWAVLAWSRADGATEWIIPRPPAWVELPILGALGGAHAGFGRGATWMTFGGLDRVMRWRTDLAAAPDTFAVPVRARRGIPIDRVRLNDYRGLGELFGMASGTADLSVLPTGGVAVLHKDLTVEGMSRTGTYYVTVLDSLGSPQCVDILVPIQPETAPITRLVADTLLVLEQEISDSGEVTTILRRWKIGTDKCTSES